MAKLAYALFVGLFGAGIVHIAILMLLPHFTERDVWTRLEARSGLYSVVPLDRPVGGSVVSGAEDPLFRSAACRFDLSEGSTRILTRTDVPYWSVSIYDRNGQNVYSLNDGAAQGGALDLVVLSPDQMIEVRKETPAGFTSSVFAEVPSGEGIAVIRAFRPDDSWTGVVDAFFSDLTCSAQ